MGKRHNLEIINIFTDDALVNENAPETYRGMDRFKARANIVDQLEALGLLERIEAHKLKSREETEAEL